MAKIIGTAGADTLSGGPASDTLLGRAGNDTLHGADSRDTLRGEAGDDLLSGGRGGDLIDGGSGDFDRAVYWFAEAGVLADLQNPSANREEAKGDRYVSIEGLIGSGFGDTLRGNAGANDLIGNDGRDSLVGREGDDRLSGGTGRDTLVAGDGADSLNGGANGDVLNGGGGDRDKAVYWDAAAGVLADLQSAAANRGEARGDSYKGIEGFDGSRFDDTLRGDGGANRLLGLTGKDSLVGRDGADMLYGMEGKDTLIGGDDNDILNGGTNGDVLNGGAGGSDKAVYWDAAKGVLADLEHSAANRGEANGDTYQGIEGLDGSRFNDILRGDAGGNILDGQNGRDRLAGRAGQDILFGGNDADTLQGGDDNDSLAGGGGADVLDGGAGTFDKAVYWNALAGVLADLDNSNANRGEAKGDTYVGIEGLDGSQFNDTLRGDDGGNFIYGGAGNDWLIGRDGADTLIGNVGNDTLLGGDGDDRLIGDAGADVLNGGAGERDQAAYSNATSRVTVDLQDPSVNTGEAKGDTFFGVEDLVGSQFDDGLRGDALVNHLFGGGGDDALNGRAGNDIIGGDRGADVLTGGPGKDGFLFFAPLGADNVDAITDFQVSVDDLYLARALFDLLPAGTLPNANFVSGSVAVGSGPAVVHNSANGHVLYDADGAGGADAILFATVTPGLELTASDFFVY